MGDFYNRDGGALTTTTITATTITADDLEVDSGTLSIDETNNRVGMGTTEPTTILHIASTGPIVAIQNSTSENTDGGCEGKLMFADHAANALVTLEGSHSGSSDDSKGQFKISTDNGSGSQLAMSIDDAQKAIFSGDLVAYKAFAAAGASGTFGTFSDGDATPSVAAGNLWKHHASPQTITMFDDGTPGQVITVISTAAITYDVTSTNLKGGSTDIVTASGDVTQWCFDGTNWYLLQFMDVTADHSTIGGGGGGADANDLDHILHQQVFGR